MANNQNIQRTITVSTNAGETNQQLATSEQLLTELIDSQRELNQNVVDGAQRQEAALKKTNKSVESLGNGFKAVGLSIKALGIGLLLEAFSALKDIISGSQPIVDAFSTTFKALNIAFNDFVKFVSANSDGVVSKFKSIFSDPVGSIKSFGNAIKENLVERFNSYLTTLGKVASGLKELFTGNFDAARKEFVGAAKESVDIFTGVNNTVDRTTDAVTKAAQATVDYTKKIFSQADALTKLENRAKIAEANNEKLIKQYEIQAENLRQVRDDETLTLEVRQKASKDLEAVLIEQGKVMSANAQIVIDQANQQLKLNNNNANSIAVTKAQTAALDVQATVVGFLSEQKTSDNALTKDAIALGELSIDGTNRRAKIERDFAAGFIKDEKAKLEAIRENILIEQKEQTDALTKKRDQYGQNTLAYEEANQALLDAQQEYNNQLITNDRATQDYITAKAKEEADKRKQIADAELQQKIDVQNQQLDLATEGINILKGLSEKNKAIQKALIIAENAAGIGKIIINTLAANAKAVAASPLTGGQPFVTLNTIQGGIGVAGTIAATAKALSALGGGSAGGGGATAGAMGGATSAPTFNTVGASGENQLAEQIAAQQGQVPVAQVVSSQVTTQQALDRQVINNATFL